MASAVPRFEEWLSSEKVGRLSSELRDPEEFVRQRAGAYDRFRHLEIEPNPLYRGYGYFTNVDLAGIEPSATGSPVRLPPPIEGSVRIVHDVSGTRVELPEELRKDGVRAIALSEVWGSGTPEVEAFLRGTEEPADRLSALATALLNRGYRLEVPDHFPHPVRVQELCLLSTQKEALSVRRSVRVGEGAQLLATEEVYSTESPPEDSGCMPPARTSTSPITRRQSSSRCMLRTSRPSRSTDAPPPPGPIHASLGCGTGSAGTARRSATTPGSTGRGSVVEDFQTFYGAQDQSYDSSFDLTHIATDTHGTSITRGVFTDRARGMSRGLVRIEPDARKTVALISEHAMLLSRGARSDTIPILEILCRDVKATHSTSVAPVDPEKVFYLESRGISTSDAVRMIGEGFLANVYDRAPVAGLRELLYPSLQARWDGSEILWKDGQYPALPRLDVTGTDAAPDWRFDSKLR